MKNYKRILALLLAVACLATLLCSCAANGNTPNNTQSSGQKGADTTAGTGTVSDDTTGGKSTPSGSGEAFDEFPRPRVKDKLKVGYIVMDVSSDSMISTMNQAKVECAHRGWEFVDGSCEGDEMTRDAVKNLINQDVDVIILGNMGLMDAKLDVIAEAREKGIGVYCNDNEVVKGVIAGTSLANGVGAAQMMYRVGADYGWDLNSCVIYENHQLGLERYNVAKGLMDNVYPNFTMLSSEDANASPLFYLQAAYEYAQTWLQQYGDDLDMIFCIWDGHGMSAAEAIIQSGDPHGDKTFVAGMGGGNMAWKYIRDNTPLKYTYSQPFELYTHNIFECIAQIQQQGMAPGDEGCIISHPGEVIYSEGMITTRENVPAVGESVHAVFNYYGMDKDDPDAWFNWTDGPGIPLVKDGTEDIAGQIDMNG